VSDGPGGGLTGFRRAGNIAGAGNYVISDAENSYGTAWRGKAFVSDPSSPLYAGANGTTPGKFGVRYLRTQEPNIGSQAAIDARAAVVLANNALLPEVLTLTTIPNPSLDVFQVITAVRNNVTRSAQVQHVDIDANGGPTTIAARVTAVNK
jgi:hypothetical protein